MATERTHSACNEPSEHLSQEADDGDSRGLCNPALQFRAVTPATGNTPRSHATPPPPDRDRQCLDSVTKTRSVHPHAPPATTPEPRPGVTPAPQAWAGDLKKASELVERKRREHQVKTPVRVAILDTGLNRDLAVFNHKPGLANWITCEKDFVQPSALAMTDTFGHGTFMARLVMECAPGAEIYVARVAENSKALERSQGNVVKAIFWAGQTVKADIISMSFGFARDDDAICEAIETVRRQRKHEVIFLASAGNSATDDEGFPARHPEVISVYATNGSGIFSERNPLSTRREAAVLATYGEGVPESLSNDFATAYPERSVCEPGSSVATAVMAAISATMLAYATVLPSLVRLQGPAASTSDRVMRHLWTGKGMEAVLYRLAQESRSQPYCRAVMPARFWKNRSEDLLRYCAIIDALSAIDAKSSRPPPVTSGGTDIPQHSMEG